MIVLKVILFMLSITGLHCRHPDKVYCVNEGCDEPISKAKTLLNYRSVDPDLISFLPNNDAFVYMKSAGTNTELWFVKINGKSGFANSKFLREYKIIEKNPLIVVSYKPKAQGSVQPNKVKQAHEVIEGTTIYTTEAAVNNAQHDATTESPVTTSNEDHTPSLSNAKEMLNENYDINIQNIPDPAKIKTSENQLSESQNSDPTPNDEKIDIATITAFPEQTDKSIEADINDFMNNVESSVQTLPKSSEEVLLNNLERKDAASTEQLNQELQKKLSSETSAQQLLSTISGSISSNNLLDVPDNKEFNSLTESEPIDSVEQNVSSLNTNEENVKVTEETVTEPSNVANGDINPLSEPLELMDSVIVTDQNNNEPLSANIQTNENTALKEQLQDQPPTILPIIETETSPPVEPLPPIETVSTTQSPTLAAALETESNTKPPLDPVLNFPPVPETGPNLPLAPETGPNLPPAPETVPNFPPSSDTVQTYPFIPDTIPALPPTTSETIPLLYSETLQSIPDNGQVSETYYTTSTPDYSFKETDNPETTTEYIPVQDPSLEEDANTAYSQEPEDILTSTTETPVEVKDTQGFISNIFSTMADIWPFSSDSPPSIYNTEDYPLYESEKSDTTEEINEGFSFMKYIMSTYYSVMGTSEETKALFASVGETCYSDEYCDGTSNDGSNRLLTFLLTTASSVLLFTLGYYYIDNRRQDGRLIGQINSLQRDLLFTSKECEILKEELSSTKSKLAGIEDSSFGMDDMVQSLKEEINELKATNNRLRNSLDDNEKLLRVSENTAGELQNTLGEVENTLSELLAERANSEEQIVELNGKVQAFEEELISVSRDRDNFQLKYVSAESALEEFKKQKKQFEDVNQKLAEAKNTIELQKHEIEALKDAIKELKSGMLSNVDVTSLIDHTEIKAKLSKAIEEKRTLESQYEAEHKERSRLSEELQTTQETLHTTSQNATEALTRLEVLGKYFQERESELLKELSAKESLWLSKQGESTSTVEKIELLQQEVQRYKEKCDALTLELAEQESSRRTVLSSVEARAHAAWLDARAAKRDADAARDEAAALRRKLAALSTMPSADGAVSPHHKVASPLENIENPVIPPPLPPMFLPPPLLPPLPRPPPLGRLPSPHPPRYGDRRYSPESRYSPGSRYSPDSRYSPETVRYSPDSHYSPRTRLSPYSPRSRRRSRSRERFEEVRGTRSRNGPADTETEYNSDSPSREPRRRSRFSRHSGPSSGSGCSSESDK